MTYDQAKNASFNPFDVTKVWPQAEYPLIPVGKFTLDRNPSNYFAEVEQIAFSPANLVPGIEPSPDKMLQGKICFIQKENCRQMDGKSFIFLLFSRRRSSLLVQRHSSSSFGSKSFAIAGELSIPCIAQKLSTRWFYVLYRQSRWCTKLFPKFVWRSKRMRTCTLIATG